MPQYISSASITCMAISCFAGAAIPVGLFLLFRRKTKAETLPFFVGCAIFIIFVGLESILVNLLLSSPVGSRIVASTALMALVGGLRPGRCEETGRLVAYRTVLKDKMGNDANALMYGAGHGGVEAVAILVVSMLSNLALAITINRGGISSLTAVLGDAEQAQLEVQLSALATTPAWHFLLGIVERIFAVAAHLSFSVMVWFGVKQRKPSLYLLAVALHAVMDAVTVVMTQAGLSPIVEEIIVGVMAAGVVVLGHKVWQQYAAKE